VRHACAERPAVERPARLDFASVRAALLRIVPLCLDSDPSLLPLSARPGAAAAEPERDPDDFRFWSERQARRIAGAIAQAFGVEYAPEVVLADANVSALANRILVSTEVLSPA
jgi:phosphatidylethanolamine N-methyltransferase